MPTVAVQSQPDEPAWVVFVRPILGLLTPTLWCTSWIPRVRLTGTVVVILVVVLVARSFSLL